MYAGRGRVVTCSLTTGRKLVLGRYIGPDQEGIGIAAVIAEGQYVAYQSAAQHLEGHAASSSQLLMINARTRRAVPFGGAGCSNVAASTVHFPSVELTPRGYLAWTCVATSESGGRVEVHRFDSRGPALLDSSSDAYGEDVISAESLALSAHTGRLYWQRQDAFRTDVVY